MRYSEFKNLIEEDLRANPAGKTWKELKASLSLPYSQPCAEWIAQLELDIGLERKEKKGNALIWKLSRA
ncbi:hypothetical protein [Rubellicoccus peritrichatus]|uniref:Uncharacterized protein n=1 Tax=Rubellicoccus peritrichatus TaxID=3080537 RepID=A0AAQ3L6M2_9BACT|nr:hypothetical protein [Puniceicoccus sp. CR14]WOO39966.1 hypothetical protein RZN69_15180 [Puniceicoccus sp. CR14]